MEESARPGAGRIAELERENNQLRSRVQEVEDRCSALRELCSISEERLRRQEKLVDKLAVRVAALEDRSETSVTADAFKRLETSVEKGDSGLRQDFEMRIVELRRSIDENVHRVTSDVTKRIRAVEIANIEMSAKAMAASANDLLTIAKPQPESPQHSSCIVPIFS